MYCINCGSTLEKDSKFCENCGQAIDNNRFINSKEHSFHSHTDKQAHPDHTPLLKESEVSKTEDANATENGINTGNIILIIIVIICGSIIYAVAYKSLHHTPFAIPNNSNVPQLNVISPSPDNSLISCLKLSNEGMASNYSGEANYSATIYNGCSTTINDIKLKVNLYKHGDTNSNDMPLDTEYFDAGVSDLMPGDSNAIKQTVSTNADLSNGFNWKVWVYSAN